MPNNDVFAVGKKNRAKTLQGIPFKPRGLKGRVRSVNNESVRDIVDDAHTYEDLCFLKQELEYYIGLMRIQGAREEHVKDLFCSIEKINKKLKNVIRLSLEQAIEPLFLKNYLPHRKLSDTIVSHNLNN